jgi:hypothetical protein
MKRGQNLETSKIAEIAPRTAKALASDEADEPVKSDALRTAIDLGLAAIERGDAKTFPTASSLVEYLKKVGANVRAVAPTHTPETS